MLASKSDSAQKKEIFLTLLDKGILQKIRYALNTDGKKTSPSLKRYDYEIRSFRMSSNDIWPRFISSILSFSTFYFFLFLIFSLFDSPYIFLFTSFFLFLLFFFFCCFSFLFIYVVLLLLFRFDNYLFCFFFVSFFLTFLLILFSIDFSLSFLFTCTPRFFLYPLTNQCQFFSFYLSYISKKLYKSKWHYYWGTILSK